QVQRAKTIRSTTPKILRNLARIFPTFLVRPLWSAQACLRVSGAGATPHEQRQQQAAALQRDSGLSFWLRLGCSLFIRVHLWFSFILLVAALLRREPRGKFFCLHVRSSFSLTSYR